MKQFITDDEATGQRLDQWLAKVCQDELSRSRLQALIRDDQLTIDGVIVSEPKTKLKTGQVIELTMPRAIDPEPKGENIELDILFEDNDVIVINKPAGLVVHPGNGNWTGTLVNALIHHCGDTLSGIGGVKRPGIVHRLDKDTSGVMIVAKNDHAHKSLSAQFADHGRNGALERSYQALVWGMPDRGAGSINAPLGRSHRDRTRQAVVNAERADARHAITHFALLEKFGAHEDGSALASLLECRLETGRTHQIRVHMAHIGHPLIGDVEYGSAFKTKANRLEDHVKYAVQNFTRQALHATSLTFEHPTTEEVMTFTSTPPKDMLDLLVVFRSQKPLDTK